MHKIMKKILWRSHGAQTYITISIFVRFLKTAYFTRHIKKEVSYLLYGIFAFSENHQIKWVKCILIT